MSGSRKFIQDEVNSLRNTIEATEFILGQWKRNAESATWPTETLPSIETLQDNMANMRRSLAHIEEILERTEES